METKKCYLETNKGRIIRIEANLKGIFNTKLGTCTFEDIHTGYSTANSNITSFKSLKGTKLTKLFGDSSPNFKDLEDSEIIIAVFEEI